jgi:acyl-CoA thioester hydrolase
MNKLTHKTLFRVRYADTDKMGVVYNGNYFSFFESGRTELMRNYGLPYTKVEELGYMLPLVDCYAKFINPAKFDDVLEINAELEYNNTAVMKFNYKIECNNKLIAEGYTRHVFVNSENMKPVRPPYVFTNIINEETKND